MYVDNLINKNLQSRNTSTSNIKRNFESHRGSSDTRFNPLINSKRNVNKTEERQTYSSKSYAETSNNNNISMTMNEEISDFNGLMYEINKLNN